MNRLGNSLILRGLGVLSALIIADLAKGETILNPGYGYTSEAIVDKWNPVYTDAVAYPPALPYGSGLLSAPGNSQYDYSAATCNLSQSGFKITIEQARTPTNNQGEARSYGALYFEVDVPTSYVLTADYAAHLNSGVSGWDNFDLQLQDLMGSDLYETHDQSLNTVDQAFTAADPHGDFSTDTLASALSGTLQPGHLYGLSYDFHIQGAGKSGDTGASATGSIELDLAPAAPLPSSCIAGLVLLSGLGLLRLRRSKVSAE